MPKQSYRIANGLRTECEHTALERIIIGALSLCVYLGCIAFVWLRWESISLRCETPLNQT